MALKVECNGVAAIRIYFCSRFIRDTFVNLLFIYFYVTKATCGCIWFILNYSCILLYVFMFCTKVPVYILYWYYCTCYKYDEYSLCILLKKIKQPFWSCCTDDRHTKNGIILAWVRSYSFLAHVCLCCSLNHFSRLLLIDIV